VAGGQEGAPVTGRARFLLAAALVTVSGFVALSYEILWVRVCSFASRGASAAFGLLLGAYLLGLALGALGSLRFQDADDTASPRQLRALAGLVLLANAVGFLLAPAAARLVTHVPAPWALPLVVVAASLLGVVLPLICHFAIPPDDRAGAALSWLYLANIVGSAAGSLVTGFVLLDRLPLATISTGLAVGGLVVAVGILGFSDLGAPAVARRAVVAAAGAAAILTAGPALHDGLWERLQRKQEWRPADRFTQVVENRSGVITVDRDGKVYGGGAYDGQFGTDVRRRTWLVRPYVLSALHPEPSEVLMIGLASGSWAQIVANSPEVERLTIVEINPGYLQIIPRDPSVAGLVTNDKVEVVIDDARRWLAAHPERRFDAVVFNATHSWRSFASNVLSVQFLELVRAHLAPGGIYFFNTTFSPDAQRTAATVFPHALLVINCIAVSDSPIRFDPVRWRSVLERYALDGVPLFDLGEEDDLRILDHLLALAGTLDRDLPDTRFKLETRAQVLQRTEDARLVTDDNMATEWRL